MCMCVLLHFYNFVKNMAKVKIMAGTDVLEHRVKVVEKRVDRLETIGVSMNQVNIAIQKLTDTTDNLVKVIEAQNKKLEDQNKRLNAIEQKPAKRMEKVENAMLAKVGGGLGFIILVLIVIIILFATKVF